MTKFYLAILLIAMASVSSHSYGAETLEFDCRRAEKDYIEDYSLKITPASIKGKAKIYLDERDLDQSDTNGTQIVKSIVITKSDILMTIDAHFAPELIEGVAYPAGTVYTQITLNRLTGKLKKIEAIQGGILGANLGNGTRSSEETCVPSKSNSVQ